WGEGSYYGHEGAAGADGACLFDRDAGEDSTANDYGCDGAGELWRSGVRYGGERAGEGGVGRAREEYRRYGGGGWEFNLCADGCEAEGRAERCSGDRADAGALFGEE